ncbi:MAG: hypothetical protein ACE3JQ_02400 [Paenisporosarcina sp.]
MKNKNKVTPSEKKMPKQLIYIGPNIPKYGLNRYSVYKNGLPSLVEDTTIRSLFVGVSQLQNSEERVQRVGTIEHTAYEKALLIARGEK